MADRLQEIIKSQDEFLKLRLMNTLKKIHFVAFFLLIIFGFISCNNDDDDDFDETTSIAALVKLDNDLSMFNEALKLAGENFVNDLNSNSALAPYTLLAPTNAAFQFFLDGSEYNELSDIPVDSIRSIILHHVIPRAEIRSSDFSTAKSGYLITSLRGGPGNTTIVMTFDARNDVVLNGLSVVIEADINASNGIIHKVNKIIEPTTVDNFIFSNPSLSLMAEAINEVGLRPVLRSDVGAQEAAKPPLTVFVPSNEAFQALLATNNQWNSISDIPKETLSEILGLHIIKEKNIDANRFGNFIGPQDAISGKITLNLVGTIGSVIGEGNSEAALVTSGNIQGTNGVIYVIDKVLVPKS